MFSPQETQLAFAVLGSASLTQDATGGLLQPLLVRASTSTATCPLLIALRDILQRRQQHQQHGTSESAQNIIAEQQRQYESDLRDAERQCDPLRIARDKLKAELQRVETLLQNAETAARRCGDGVLVCKSLLQSLQSNVDAGFEPSTVTAGMQQQASGSGLPAQQSNSSGSNAAAAAATMAQPNRNAPQPQLSSSNNNNHSNQQQQHHQDPTAPSIPAAQQASATANANANASSSRSGSATTAAAATPLTVDATTELLHRSSNAGTDEQHRAALVPALARIEARLSRPGSIVDESHALLAEMIVSPRCVEAMHESVQVHAFRAVLAMLRKIADDRSSNNNNNNSTGSNNTLSSKLHRAGLHSFGCCRDGGLRCFITLFANGNDDDVKAEVLECLTVLVAEPDLVNTCCQLGAVAPLVQLIATSSSEPVLERALLFFWSLASTSDRVRDEAIRSNGVPALVDLLYTDSLPILDNTMIALGYLSRDERAKVALGENGGLEKVVSCLYHPSPSVLVKAAGVVWNAAVVEANRATLRSLGAIPALLQLLRSTSPAPPSEVTCENITGALWNLTVDQDAKKELADYEGLQLFVNLIRNSVAESVLENASGTLWNCSANMDNRAALRRHGALPLLLHLLEHPSERIQENAAGAIRNLVINDHCKVAMRECGGIEAILEKMGLLWNEVKRAANNNGNGGGAAAATTAVNILDKLIASLWILTVTPENRPRIQPSFKMLLEFASASDLLAPGTREKVVGTLRHCCSVAEARKPLVQLGAFSVLVNFAASLGLSLPTVAVPNVAPLGQASIPLRENIAYTIWNLAREDRETGRRSGALGVVVFLLGDEHDNVVEFAAGAVAALINSSTNEGRNDLGDLGGIGRLCDVFLHVATRANRSSSSSASSGALIVLLHNVLHALRYGTSAGCERNISAVLDRHEDIVTRLIQLVDVPVPASPGGAISSDDISREAILLLKNIITSSDGRAPEAKDKCRLLNARLNQVVATAAASNSENSQLLMRAAQSLQGLLAQ